MSSSRCCSGSHVGGDINSLSTPFSRKSLLPVMILCWLIYPSEGLLNQVTLLIDRIPKDRNTETPFWFYASLLGVSGLRLK